MSGAGARPVCSAEVAPTVPPSPTVCGFSGLLAAREEMLLLLCLLLPQSLQTWSLDKNCVCSRQHVRIWVLQSWPKDHPRALAAASAVQGLFHLLVVFSLQHWCLSETCQWEFMVTGGELVFPVPSLCETKLVLSSRKGWSCQAGTVPFGSQHLLLNS